MEQVYKNWTEGLALWVTMMFKTGKELCGEDFIRKLEEKFYKAGARLGSDKSALLEETGTDCKAIGKILDAVDESMANYWDGYVENSPTGFEKHITTCPVAEIFSKEPEICTRLVPAMGQGLVSGINPNTRLQFYEFLTKGDKSCHYRVEIKP